MIAASWEALVDSLEYAEQRRRGHRARARPGGPRRRVSGVRRRASDPARAAGARRGGGAGACSRCCARASSRSARACRRSRRRSRRASGAPHASAVSSGTAGAAPGAARRRRGGRRRGRHVAVLVRGLAPTRSLYERARPVFADIDPVHAEPRPGRGRGGGHRAHDARCCRCTSSATRPTCRRSSALGLPIVEDACEALGAVHADGVAGRRPRPPGRVRLLRQQAAHDGRGRDGHARPTARSRSAIDSERNQGRAPDMGWLDHDRLGFNYRLTRHRVARSGWCSSSASTTMLAGRARVAALLPRGARPSVEGLGLPCPDAGGDAPRLVRLRRPAPARRRPRRRSSRALRERGVQSKPYLPAIHLM